MAKHVVQMFATTVFLLLVGAACAGAGSSDDDGLIIAACDSDEDTWTYLADEPPGFRDNPGFVTWTVENCVINANFVFHRSGDEHCEMQETEFISIGLPVGTPYTGPNAIPPGQDWMPEFFFNADGAWETEPPGVELAASDLPPDAVDVGLLGAGGRTMFIAADEATLWVVQDDVAKAFVEPTEEVACA